MNLSQGTVETLKSLSNINQSLMFKKGKTQKTLSVAKTIFAEVQIEDDFPIDFGIYDLPEFLNTLSLFDNPLLEFSDKSLKMSDSSGATCSYTYSDPNVIISPPEKGITMPSVELAFDMTKSNFDKLMKASSVLGLADVAITTSNGVLSMGVTDKASDSSNEFSFDVGKAEESDNFNIHIRAELMKLLPDDYQVEISKEGFSRFVGKTNKAEYFIALETTSSFS